MFKKSEAPKPVAKALSPRLPGGEGWVRGAAHKRYSRSPEQNPETHRRRSEKKPFAEVVASPNKKSLNHEGTKNTKDFTKFVLFVESFVSFVPSWFKSFSIDAAFGHDRAKYRDALFFK